MECTQSYLWETSWKLVNCKMAEKIRYTWQIFNLYLKQLGCDDEGDMEMGKNTYQLQVVLLEAHIF
jgi:hypothetical protein